MGSKVRKKVAIFRQTVAQNFYQKRFLILSLNFCHTEYFLLQSLRFWKTRFPTRKQKIFQLSDGLVAELGTNNEYRRLTISGYVISEKNPVQKLI